MAIVNVFGYRKGAEGVVFEDVVRLCRSGPNIALHDPCRSRDIHHPYGVRNDRVVVME